MVVNNALIIIVELYFLYPEALLIRPLYIFLKLVFSEDKQKSCKYPERLRSSRRQPM